MTHVEIEYCVPCGLIDPALKTQQSLLNEFGQQLDGVQLSPGHGGIFKVHADGETVWDKDVHGGDLDLEFIGEAVAERIDGEA